MVGKKNPDDQKTFSITYVNGDSRWPHGNRAEDADQLNRSL